MTGVLLQSSPMAHKTCVLDQGNGCVPKGLRHGFDAPALGLMRHSVASVRYM